MASHVSPDKVPASFDAVYGSDWPIRLRVFQAGLRKPIGVVKAHPLDPSSLYWEGHARRTIPSPIDPRPWRPMFGRLLDDIRWSDGRLPARGARGAALTVDRAAVLRALAAGSSKLVLRNGPPRGVHTRRSE